MSITDAYTLLYSAALVYLAALMAVMLYRAIRLTGAADRLIATNMIGTMINAAILILAAKMKENWLIDVALIYTMISFISVMILCRITVRPAHAETENGGGEETEDE